MQNELRSRATKSDVAEMVYKGGSPDELSSDMQNITKNMAKLVKELRVHKQDCMSFNE